MEFTKIKPRETAGPDANSRLDYQKHWSMLEMLKEFEQGIPFLCLIDCHEDVVMIDNVDSPTKATFYQIKTKKGAGWSNGYMSPFLIKLWFYMHNIKNKEEIESFNIISNCYSENDEINKSLTNHGKICVSSLNAKYLKSLSKKLTKEYKGIDCQKCFEVTHIHKFDMDIGSSRNTVIGAIDTFLEKKYPKHNVKAGSFYKIFFDQVNQRTSAITRAASLEEMQKLKGISFQDLKTFIESTPKITISLKHWNSIEQKLQCKLTDREVYFIRNAYQDIFLNKISYEATVTEDYTQIKNLINKYISQNNNNFDYVNYIVNLIQTKTRIYSKYTKEQLLALAWGALYGENE